jgi:hypothetical protein
MVEGLVEARIRASLDAFAALGQPAEKRRALAAGAR